MARTEEEREFRLRQRKPRLTRNGRAGWSTGFRLLMHYARITSKRSIRRTFAGKTGAARPYQQRCAVRVTYLRNNTRGQWKAHGRYLGRESAAQRSSGNGGGFSRGGEVVDIASKLDTWQKAGDERLWKLIVSPEFGEKVDLTRLTRELIEQMERDLGTDLDWVAVEHYDTEHPHVHIVVRALRNDGNVLRMSRQYVQQGIRHIAENLCTRQLGYRTQLDEADAERREIAEKRFTSIDRRLIKDASQTSLTDGRQYFAVDTARLRTRHGAARLAVLERMGLAESTGFGTWLVRQDFEQILRAMQRAADWQKTLAMFGALMSDERLPIEVLDVSRMNTVEGRVLVHGQDEQSGRNYLMLESTDAKVYFVHYTPEIEHARSRGELRINSFARMRNLPVSGSVVLDLQDLGNSEALLSKPLHFKNAAKRLLKRGVMPTQDGWGGWLGRYQAALAETAAEISKRTQEMPGTNYQGKRQQERSFGRRGLARVR